MVKKTLLSFMFLLMILSMIYMPAFAEGTEYLPDEYKDFTDSIPEDIAKLLPDGIFSSDINEVREGVEEASSFEYFTDRIFDLIGLNLHTVVTNFAIISSLLVVCSLLNMFKNSLKSEAVSHVLSMVGNIAIMATILKIANEPLERINLFFDNIKVFVNTMTPVVCSLYAMGGNVSTAVVQNFGLMAFLTIFENVCIASLKIVLSVCISLAIASAFLPNINLRPLSDAVKKTFTFILGLLMLVFSTVMSAQTLLAVKSDSFTSKTAKMFAGQIIPIVGSTVGDSLRTAGASIEYLRSTTGVGLIIIFMLLVLPEIISVWFFRLIFIASGSISGLLGCEGEGKTLGEIASIYGYILAIISICSISLLFLLTLFARCTSALS